MTTTIPEKRVGGVHTGPTGPDHPGNLGSSSWPIVPMAIDYRGPAVREWHHHSRGQLLYAVEGTMQVSTDRDRWTIAPEQAVWVPPEIEHRVSHHSGVAMRTLYVDQSVAIELPGYCCVLSVSVLLRELIVRSMEFGKNYRVNTPEWRILMVIIDELKTLQSVPLNLPYPRDHRLVRIAESLQASPGNNRSLAIWASLAGASERTLARLFIRETGMTFGAWRERLRLLEAIRLLVAGKSVTSIALELGYQGSSAFITMFKRNMDQTPAQFVKRPN